MIEQFHSLHKNKLNVIITLVECANLLLQVELTSVNKVDKELSKHYSRLSKAVPDDFELSDKRKPNNFILSHIFIGLISEIEGFFDDIARIILRKYPKKIRDISFSLTDVLDANSVDQLVEDAINRMLNYYTYKKPSDYLMAFLDIISAPDNLLNDVWPQYVEMKARRDLGVHNNWQRNDVYLAKIQEVGVDDDGLQFKGITNDYFIEATTVTEKLIEKTLEHCTKKFT